MRHIVDIEVNTFLPEMELDTIREIQIEVRFGEKVAHFPSGVLADDDTYDRLVESGSAPGSPDHPAYLMLLHSFETICLLLNEEHPVQNNELMQEFWKTRDTIGPLGLSYHLPKVVGMIKPPCRLI